MRSEDSADSAAATTDRPPPSVKWAGAGVVVQGLAGLGFGLVLVLRTGSADLPVSSVLGEAALFGLFGLVLAAVGVGLVVGRRGLRTPAIVVQLLLLPTVYSLLGPSRQILLGILAGALVVGTFLLLISERSRAWSMGLDLPDPPP